MLNIMYINARSVRNKIEDIEIVLHSFKNKPDILVVTEVWLYEDEIKYYQITGYNAEISSRSTRGGGVAVYMRQELKYSIKLNKELNRCNYLMINMVSANIQLLAVYRPPSVKHSVFLNDLENIIREINDDTLLIGCHINPK